jgi:hypothetical protein
MTHGGAKKASIVVLPEMASCECGGCTEMIRDDAEPPPPTENKKRPETLRESLRANRKE